MNVPELHVVAMRGVTGFGVWHLAGSAKPEVTLCGRKVEGLVSRRRGGDQSETCRGCLAWLDHQTLNRLKLENTNAG